MTLGMDKPAARKRPQPKPPAKRTTRPVATSTASRRIVMAVAKRALLGGLRATKLPVGWRVVCIATDPAGEFVGVHATTDRADVQSILRSALRTADDDAALDRANEANKGMTTAAALDVLGRWMFERAHPSYREADATALVALRRIKDALGIPGRHRALPDARRGLPWTAADAALDAASAAKESE